MLFYDCLVSCDFDRGTICDYSYLPGKFNWTLHTGSSYSTGTGPSSDVSGNGRHVFSVFPVHVIIYIINITNIININNIINIINMSIINIVNIFNIIILISIINITNI